MVFLVLNRKRLIIFRQIQEPEYKIDQMLGKILLLHPINSNSLIKFKKAKSTLFFSNRSFLH